MEKDIYRSQFRLPQTLFEQLKAEADKNRRSLNAELVARLEDSFRQTGSSAMATKMASMLTSNFDGIIERAVRDAIQHAINTLPSDGVLQAGSQEAGPQGVVNSTTPLPKGPSN